MRLEKRLRIGSIDQAEFDRESARIKQIIKERGDGVDQAIAKMGPRPLG